jgi:acyl-coenzyme A thioesterase PaaI-like protein
MARPRPWATSDPRRLIGHGHPAGDFLEAHEWVVLERRPGMLRVDAHLPQHVRNPRGQLFGGFTPAYVDLIALFTVISARDAAAQEERWLATTSIRVDYFEPVLGPRFVMESELVKARGRFRFVETRFRDPAGLLLVSAATSLREVAPVRDLGDG